MKTKKFLYDQELTHSLTKMNGIKIIDSFAKLFCHHTNWQNATKAGRTNSRTICQQNRIAISHLSYLPELTLSSCLFLHLLLLLWQRELHSRLAFLHEQLFFVQSLLQLQ